MPTIKIVFEYYTGVKHKPFRNVCLLAGWTAQGKPSPKMRTLPMLPMVSADGCPAFKAEVFLDSAMVGQAFEWSVMVDVPGRPNVRGIMTEGGPFESGALNRRFVLSESGSVERYWLTHARRLGANRFYLPDQDQPAIQFTVWAPNALKVETVIATDEKSGYIWDNGQGAGQVLAMARDDDGLWHTDVNDEKLADFNQWVGRCYMYRITRDDRSVVYRGDIYSRAQRGAGGRNPEKDPNWDGTSQDLDPTKSCSVVTDAELVAASLKGFGKPGEIELSEDDFWAREFNPLRPLPSRIEDLVIYEMHVGGLGFGHEGPGDLKDAIDMLDYLTDLGVNAIELLPLNVFNGEAGWGYGTSHFFAIKYDEGGHDQFKHFVRFCHQRGIAVIMDVVYNHFAPDGERAEWQYDSAVHDKNIYYYYQGLQSDYPENFPEGGYCDNLSTGFLPNMAEEMVRKMFISSAVTMAMEFHVDGFRMDLTQALHSFNVLHFDGSPAPRANEAGIRFMREWVRTIRLFKPFAILMSEDHSGWKALTRPQSVGGIGFDASWWSEWYHQLIGDAGGDNSRAGLIYNAGLGGDDPLNMELFGLTLLGTPRQVVYHESHDEAGNSQNSARTMQLAVNGMLFDNTRFWAEARCRVAAGLTIVSAGTPMFFMGEEVGAANPYRYNDFLEYKEDYQTLRGTTGARMFRFYQDLIRVRMWSPALRSPSVELVHTDNKNRILAFRRWSGDEEYLVIASLNNLAFQDGYPVTHDSLTGKTWLEVINSDDEVYGGSEVLNPEALVGGPDFKPRLPACGLTVLVKIS